MILVDEAARGRGIGSAIVTAVLDRVADMQRSVSTRRRAAAASTSASASWPPRRLARVGGTPADARGAARRRPGRARSRPAISRRSSRSTPRPSAPIARARSAGLTRGRLRSPGARSTRAGSRATAWDGRATGPCTSGPVVAPDVAMARALVAASAAAAAPGEDLMLDVPTTDARLDGPRCCAAWACASSVRSRACTARAARPPGWPELTLRRLRPGARLACGRCETEAELEEALSRPDAARRRAAAAPRAATWPCWARGARWGPRWRAASAAPRRPPARGRG